VIEGNKQTKNLHIERVRGYGRKQVASSYTYVPRDEPEMPARRICHDSIEDIIFNFKLNFLSNRITRLKKF
jgi:hypothetical protein